MHILSFDQSISAFGWYAIQEDGGCGGMGTILPSDRKAPSIARAIELSDLALATIDVMKPMVVTMEGYAYSMHGQADAILKELGGLLKAGLYRRGYREGRIGTYPKLMRVQGQGAAKKFTLSNGAAKKDKDYLPLIERMTGKKFPDDNQADAYMHAQLARQTFRVATGCMKMSDFPDKHQEALMSNGFSEQKKRFPGMTLERAVKVLGEAEKTSLVSWS